jgi:hypothetical protein
MHRHRGIMEFGAQEKTDERILLLMGQKWRAITTKFRVGFSLLAPFPRIGWWSLSVSAYGHDKPPFRTRYPDKEGATFLIGFPPEGLIFDPEYDHRIKLKPFALVNGSKANSRHNA